MRNGTAAREASVIVGKSSTITSNPATVPIIRCIYSSRRLASWEA